jgi:hypothetical protein
MLLAQQNRDQGFQASVFSSLEMEHLEQLFLDRTAITDDGITTISSKH